MRNAISQLEFQAVPADVMTVREARALWANFRYREGWAHVAVPLLSDPSGNLKLGKSVVPSFGLSLAPHRISGANVCVASTVVCRGGCVAYNGHAAKDPHVMMARATKTRFMFAHPEAFVTLLEHEIRLAVKRRGRIAVRLNTFSDVAWERVAPHLFEIDGVTFYDYTKRTDRTPPAGYHLTVSATERTTVEDVRSHVLAGSAVAVVLNVKRSEPVPTTWHGMPVTDGDKTDERWEDGGTVVALRAKGKLIGDRSGFVKAP